MEKCYEENILRLEEIVQRLERGELTLEEGLTLFEEGISLVKVCQKQIDRVSDKIRMLTKEGNFAELPGISQEE